MKDCQDAFDACEGTVDECDNELKTCLQAFQDYNW